MTVRQVAADYPGCREVFHRHGEPDDRPTRFGHLEPIDRFARRRGIALGALLSELADATGVSVSRDGGPAHEAHRLFLVAALVLTLSLGAGWGGLLLVEIGRAGTFVTISAAAVVAHGEAQLWGFVALFVVGIALGFLPLATARPRPGRVLRGLILATLLVGVIGGFAWSLRPFWWPWLGPASGTALVVASLGFLLVSCRHLARKLREPWSWFILAAAFWMVLWASSDLMLRGRFSLVGPRDYSEDMRRLLMDLAIFGFTLNAIYGFGQRLLPGLLGGGAPGRAALVVAFGLHNGGVLALAIAHFVSPVLFTMMGLVTVGVGALGFVLGLRGLRRGRLSATRPEAGPAFLTRYIQVAFGWLLAGLALLVAGQLTVAAWGVPLPHAYLGAARHALTVGFVTTLIIGVGQRLIPILSHRLLAWPRLVVPIFALIAAGNALRVASELATLAWPVAFRIMPISAAFEFAALILFAANITRTLWPRPDELLTTGRATLGTPVALLLAEHSWLEDHLVARGLRYPARVRSVPAELTLGSLIKSEGLPPTETVSWINALLREHADDSMKEQRGL
jgi:hypothetical protein